MTDSMAIRKCEMKELETLSEFVFRINNRKEHSSTFCSKNPETIRKEIEESITSDSAISCWQGERLIGILSCYIDEEKNNGDCNLLIEPAVLYDVVAKNLFDALHGQFPSSIRYTFFFPKENKQCAEFLQRLGARKEVNEYALILKRKNRKDIFNLENIKELAPERYPQFVELHDSIFPGVYISGKDIIEDIGKRHFIYSLVEKEQLLAYSVLRVDNQKHVTAEIVAVRSGFRNKGYGRAVLAYLIDKAFTDFEAEYVELIVDGDNENAIHLYLDMGFDIKSENCCYIY
ncbi:GNAT family N-acetyltransferase [Anaerocolumna chitinilytica]|uniref:N-acetyltransferase domain-containing protein n=1 Tax=Anaerocolumna chitinilytica TaxID=1727145 RepID=A0A7M3S981_9FIRM|nr:GNAT family N-acetyltransferase [Anaerocolumna chitinilytica]BCK01149.1 hypothetical protein bsdcttw_41890 [Anaerocolumna chitinilytica]